MRFLCLLGLLLLSASAHGQLDSLRLQCKPQKIDFVEGKDLLGLYRQRDTLPNHRGAEAIVLVINQQAIRLQDSTSIRYLASLQQEYPALDSLWAPILHDEIQGFGLQKDSLQRLVNLLGWKMRYLQAARNLRRQQALKQSGRSQVLLSFHNFNLAADLGLYVRRRYLRRSPRYIRVGGLAKQVGMFWGGDFVGFPDPGHVQRFANSAALVMKYPSLAFEFEKYRDHYESIYRKNAMRLDLVRDTEALLIILNRLKVGKVCACQKALLPNLNLPTEDAARVEVNTAENNVFIKPYQSNGYYYALGRWEYLPKK